MCGFEHFLPKIEVGFSLLTGRNYCQRQTLLPTADTSAVYDTPVFKEQNRWLQL